MAIKLVAVDLDGTLLTGKKTITENTVRAVARAARHGIEVAFSTGRDYGEFASMLRTLPDIHYAVACTGASVIDCRSGRELCLDPLGPGELRLAWETLRGFDLIFEVFLGGKIYAEAEKVANIGYYLAATHNPPPRGSRTPVENFGGWLASLDRPATKIHMYFRDHDERDRAWDAAKALPLSVCTSDDYDLEIMARHVDKGAGLRRLAEYLRLDRREILAVGDSLNDLGMLEYAGQSAVMGNGLTELKEKADIIADTNERDGVAKLLDALSSGELETGAAGRKNTVQ